VGLGYPVTQNDVNSNAGAMALTLRNNFDAIRHMKLWLDTRTEQDLTALGYTAGEVAQLKAAFADMDQLRIIWEGGATLPTAKDFRAFAKLLTGAS